MAFCPALDDPRACVPELPDITVYLECLAPRVLDQVLEHIRLGSPFLLRSVEPPPSALEGRRVVGLERLGKRIVLALEDEHFLVLHLMIAGRLRWSDARSGESAPPAPRRSKRAQPATAPNAASKASPGRPPLPGRVGLAAFDFTSGTLILTEAGTKRRAGLWLVRGRESLAEHDRGGLEVLEADLEAFSAALTRESHTLERALTDPRLFSGIGNAYSDEILHRARLSPLKLTRKLSEEERARLFEATRDTLLEWTARLRAEAGAGFPEKVTAFREGMAVHGRYRAPCPTCGAPVQRIVYAENETNYCPRCQNEDRLLADRSLSRLLADDWPKTVDELEQKKRRQRGDQVS